MDPATIALITAGAGQTAQQFGSIFTAKKNREFAKSESDLAYRRNLEHYHRQNAYNDPSQQMARLKAAGLNPNMVYGTGSKAANTTNQDVKYTPAEGKYANPIPDVMPTIETWQDVKLKNSQAAAIDAQAHLSRVKASLEVLKIPSMVQSGIRQKIENNILESTQQEFMKAKTNEITSRMESLKQQRTLRDIEINTAKKNWELFKEYNIRPQDPIWLKEAVPRLQQAIQDGSFEEFKKELNLMIERGKHLINIGIGTNMETRWNQ